MIRKGAQGVRMIRIRLGGKRLRCYYKNLLLIPRDEKYEPEALIIKSAINYADILSKG